MVNQHDPPLDQFDLFKRKHLRQNRDIIRVNSAQAQRIKSLETDVRRLLDENLALRTELIQVKCQVAQKSNSSNLVETVRNAHKALEKLLVDAAGIKNGLEGSLQTASAAEGHGIDMSNISSRTTKKTTKERRRMDLKFDEFNEERKNKQKALSASGLEAPFSGSPRVTSETEDDSGSETEDMAEDLQFVIPEVSTTQSRSSSAGGRRDSLAVLNNTVKRTTLNKSASREIVEEVLAPPPPSTTPSIATPSAPPVTKDNPRKRRRSELITSSTTTGKENIPNLPPTPQRTLEPTQQQRSVLAESSPPRPQSLFIPTGLIRIESIVSPNKPTPMPFDKDTVDKAALMEMMMDEDDGGRGRRTSRAVKKVNYALPNLRHKMRREDNGDESRGRGTSLSMDRSVTPDQGVMTVEELSTKPPPKEMITVVKAEPEMSPVHKVKVVESTSIQYKSHAMESVTKPSQKRLSLVERQSLINSSSRTQDPARKRRTSSLHKPLLPPSSNTFASTASPDIFRFPSESPPKQPVKPISRPAPSSKPPPTVHHPKVAKVSEDKENVAPGVISSWQQELNSSGRERRKTFNATLEKLAKMTAEEMQADADWEAEMKAKRRRQSVAI